MCELITLKCKCGINFKRPSVYREYIKKYPKCSFFKMKLKYCDECFWKLEKKALLALPEIMKCLM